MSVRHSSTRTVGALALAILSACSHREPAKLQPPPIPLVAARIGTADETVALAGRIGEPAGVAARLAFGMAGTVRALDARIGERVGAGQALAELDASSLDLAARQAAADARAADASAAAARIDRIGERVHVDAMQYRRERALFKAGVAARKDVEDAAATVAADRANAAGARLGIAQAQALAASAQARAAMADRDLSRAILRAPRDGVISAIYVQPGQVVDSTVAAFALAPSSSGGATLDVPADDAGSIAPGDVVRARALGLRWTARISGVGASVDPATGLAIATVDKTPASLPAGTPIDATVVIGRKRGLLIPSSAIVDDPQSGKHLVFVALPRANAGIAFDARAVQLDETHLGGPNVRVLSGLSAGERVAAQGAIDQLAPPSRGA